MVVLREIGNTAYSQWPFTSKLENKNHEGKKFVCTIIITRRKTGQAPDMPCI